MSDPQSGVRPALRPPGARVGRLQRLQRRLVPLSRATKAIALVWVVLALSDFGFGIWALVQRHYEDGANDFATGAVLFVGAALFVLIANEHYDRGRLDGWQAGWEDGADAMAGYVRRRIAEQGRRP